jgi:4-hydroxy-tetrahydrodipicolinate reductase
LARLRPHAILHCTSSFLPLVKDQLMLAVRAGVNVVSSSEELLMPDLQHAALAAQIDEAARNGGATVLGTGVNPGFAMDFMAVVASAVCQSVESARCVRTVDAGTRRLPLQRKVGAGLTVAEFKAQEKTGRFGHIGMRESVALIGRGLGFELDSITQTLEPVIAGQTTKTPFLTVEKGRVAGIHNIGIGRRGEHVLVVLDLNMYVGAPQPRDEVILTGVPNVHLRFQGGVPGDQATAAILVNSVAQVVAAEPGLKTVLDLAPPRLVR